MGRCTRTHTYIHTTNKQPNNSLVGRCLAHSEPVLLVGETGAGKTAVCELFARLRRVPLHAVGAYRFYFNNK